MAITRQWATFATNKVKWYAGVGLAIATEEFCCVFQSFLDHTYFRFIA